MLDDDLRHRARRFLAGEHDVHDLDRLLLGLRSRCGAQACLREVGDFVAHRDTREKGLLTQVGRDVFTSVDVWSRKLRGLDASWADLTRAAHANLRLASDEQLRAGCGCSRGTAKGRLDRALTKVDAGRRPTEKEVRVLGYLANRFIWRPAFTAAQFASDFEEVLLRTGLMGGDRVELAERTRTFLALHALAVMHGSAILLEGGRRARLLAGFANSLRVLEVKVEIAFDELPKPLFAPVCLFATELCPDAHCEPALLDPAYPVLPSHWDFPIDLGPQGRLVRIG